MDLDSPDSPDNHPQISSSRNQIDGQQANDDIRNSTSDPSRHTPSHSPSLPGAAPSGSPSSTAASSPSSASSPPPPPPPSIIKSLLTFHRNRHQEQHTNQEKPNKILKRGRSFFRGKSSSHPKIGNGGNKGGGSSSSSDAVDSNNIETAATGSIASHPLAPSSNRNSVVNAAESSAANTATMTYEVDQPGPPGQPPDGSNPASPTLPKLEEDASSESPPENGAADTEDTEDANMAIENNNTSEPTGNSIENEAGGTTLAEADMHTFAFEATPATQLLPVTSSSDTTSPDTLDNNNNSDGEPSEMSVVYDEDAENHNPLTATPQHPPPVQPSAQLQSPVAATQNDQVEAASHVTDASMPDAPPDDPLDLLSVQPPAQAETHVLQPTAAPPLPPITANPHQMGLGQPPFYVGNNPTAIQWLQNYQAQVGTLQMASQFNFLPGNAQQAHIPAGQVSQAGQAGQNGHSIQTGQIGPANANPQNAWVLPTQVPQPLFMNPLLQAQSSNLHPTNQSLRQFLLNWAIKTENYNRTRSEPTKLYGPSDSGIRYHFSKTPSLVQYNDLKGDCGDMQGIDWSVIGVNRRKAREYRRSMFVNYVSIRESDKWMPANYLHSGGMPPNTDSFFRFRKMHVKQSVHLAHFQLRNLVASTSRTHAFYPSKRTFVRKINTITGADSIVMRFDSPTSGAQISTIATDHDVLVAGGFSGEYAVLNLNSDFVDDKPGTPHLKGRVTNSQSGISNHIEIHQLRGAAGACAAFASNDLGLRVLDLTTEKIMSTVMFDFPVNCTAISPDRRLRVVVGDSRDAYIVAADADRGYVHADGVRRPDVLQRLHGHRDFGFACAWADDGYTLATGNQDRAIKIWDIRKLSDGCGHSTPVTTMRTEMAGARGLRFSPLGSGKRVLVAAEEADFISIIDAQTYQSRQSFDIFGEIAGITMTKDGQDLMALCADPACGGLLQFERCGEEMHAANFGEGPDPNSVDQGRRGATTFDWQPAAGVTRRERQRVARKRLRSAAARNLMSL